MYVFCEHKRLALAPIHLQQLRVREHQLLQAALQGALQTIQGTQAQQCCSLGLGFSYPMGQQSWKEGYKRELSSFWLTHMAKKG